MSVPTPHISAKLGDFAKTVLMPGDPLRAKFIAENFLENAKLVTEVRNMLDYTGLYKGQEVSVMASGMGAPSMGIYAYELYNFYNVENIIRIGSCGAASPDLEVFDIVVSTSASHDSHFDRQYNLPGSFAPTASYPLLKTCDNTAEKLGIKIHIGQTASADSFYYERTEIPMWQKMGIIAMEMEAAGLYMTAAAAGKKALCMMTVADSSFKVGTTDAKQRESSFKDMMILALETAITL